MTSLGSLCTGYGGLDLAVAEAIGEPVEHAFTAEVDTAASAVLAARFPSAPNLGDIKAVDWTTQPHVDILTAGYPCQPLSLAGRRAGLADERWLWDDGVFPAIRDLRPRIVFLENVPGHLSLGFGRVLGDLASIGYVGSWRCVRASDVGAAHRRERVFIAAYPADTPRVGHGNTRPQGVGGLPAAAFRSGATALLPTPTTKEGNGPGRLDGNRNDTLRAQIALLKTPTAQLAVNGGSQHPDKRRAGGHGPTLADQVEHLLPTPTAMDSRGARNATANRTAPKPTTNAEGWTLSDVAYADRWGRYATAIARWETVIGRPAPEPVEPNRKGDGVRLAPRFVEWLMGVPDGWVTDHVSRNDALRILGNGVVPQQGANAFASLGGVR